MLKRRTVVETAIAASVVTSTGHAQAGPPATRIVTTPVLDGTEPAWRVSWLHWDSPFRAAGLRIGDLIVAVQARAVAPPAGGRELQRFVQTAIGQTDEAAGLAALGLSPGSAVALGLRRRRAGQGWETLAVQARLIVPAIATGPTGRRLLGAGGPEEMASDGFGETWASWHEKLLRDYTLILDGGWQRGTFVSRVELRRHLERKPRVDALAARWPGAFATAALADWEAVRACLDGPAVTLPPDALEFRRAAEERAAQVKAAALAAWDASVAAAKPTTIPAFPAIHPIRGDRASVIGRHVVLPPLGNRDWIAEAGHGWFVAGNDADNRYVIDAEGPQAVAMLRARNRYQKLVTPRVDAKFQFLGQVAEAPRMLVINERGRFCLELTPTAALLGDSVFVDLRQAEPEFAGEAALRVPMGAMPRDDADPAAVMQALITAAKAGDQALWNALFGTWRIERRPDGRPQLQTNASVPDSAWVQARAGLMSRVLDARVSWVGDPRLVLDGTAYPGAPRIEEVDLEIDHVGRFPEGDRIFTDTTVRRLWQLQRVDLGQGFGPWRIHSVQAI
jgi:hypothetical protein